MATVWLNDDFVDDAAASVSVRDTGLLHAAGVFTTMRAYDGKVFKLPWHLARLRKSCEALFVPLQHKDETLAGAVDELLKRNDLADARLRLTVTRGVSQHDPLHGMRLDPMVFLTAAPLEAYPQEYYDRGMTVAVLDEQKANPYDFQAGHKTLNYFSRLHALKSASQRKAGEALWFNVHNYLQSGSVSNVFLVKNGALVTPPTPEEMNDPLVADAVPYPRSAVLPGVTRRTVLELAREAGIEVRLRGITINELLDGDELFLTNSVMEVMPVSRIEKHAIGQDRPGEVTRQLAEDYRSAVLREAASG